MPIKYPSFRSNTGGQTDSALDLLQNSAIVPLTSEHPNAKNVRLVNGVVYGTATIRNEEQAPSFPITFELLKDDIAPPLMYSSELSSKSFW